MTDKTLKKWLIDKIDNHFPDLDQEELKSLSLDQLKELTLKVISNEAKGGKKLNFEDEISLYENREIDLSSERMFYDGVALKISAPLTCLIILIYIINSEPQSFSFLRDVIFGVLCFITFFVMAALGLATFGKSTTLSKMLLGY